MNEQMDRWGSISELELKENQMGILKVRKKICEMKTSLNSLRLYTGELTELKNQSIDITCPE